MFLLLSYEAVNSHPTRNLKDGYLSVHGVTRSAPRYDAGSAAQPCKISFSTGSRNCRFLRENPTQTHRARRSQVSQSCIRFLGDLARPRYPAAGGTVDATRRERIRTAAPSPGVRLKCLLLRRSSLFFWGAARSTSACGIPRATIYDLLNSGEVRAYAAFADVAI